MHHGSIRKLHLDLSREEPLSGHLVVTKARGWRKEGHCRRQERWASSSLKYILDCWTYIYIYLPVTKYNKVNKQQQAKYKAGWGLYMFLSCDVVFLCLYFCTRVRVGTCACSSTLPSVQFFWWSMKISALFFSHPNNWVWNNTLHTLFYFHSAFLSDDRLLDFTRRLTFTPSGSLEK